MKVLLVGGAGYIGNIVTNYLLNEGYDVISYDLLMYKNNHTVLNHISNKKYSFVFGDMNDVSKLEPLIEKAEAVVLLAGLVGDPITKKYPARSKKINDHSVKTVIDLSSKKTDKKFIFISTCSNYGLISDDELADENFKLNPLSLYAKSKVNAEKYILGLKNKTSMTPTILRFATAYGISPRMRFDLTINEFTLDLFSGKDLLVYDADTWRPYCHVLDFARLIQIVIESPKNKVSFETFNAGGDKNNATKQMIVNMIMENNLDGNVSYKKHGTDPRNYRVNFNKVKSILNFIPKYSIRDGIEEIISLSKSHIFDLVKFDRTNFGNYEIDNE